MSDTDDDYLALLNRERARLEQVRVLESDNAALRNANEALHRKLDALEGRAAVRFALGVAAQLDRAPVFKRTMSTIFRAVVRKR